VNDREFPQQIADLLAKQRGVKRPPSREEAAAARSASLGKNFLAHLIL